MESTPTSAPSDFDARMVVLKRHLASLNLYEGWSSFLLSEDPSMVHLPLLKGPEQDTFSVRGVDARIPKFLRIDPGPIADRAIGHLDMCVQNNAYILTCARAGNSQNFTGPTAWKGTFLQTLNFH